jgi:hypothetical protein
MHQQAVLEILVALVQAVKVLVQAVLETKADILQ